MVGGGAPGVQGRAIRPVDGGPQDPWGTGLVLRARVRGAPGWRTPLDVLLGAAYC